MTVMIQPNWPIKYTERYKLYCRAYSMDIPSCGFRAFHNRLPYGVPKTNGGMLLWNTATGLTIPKREIPGRGLK